MSFLMLALLVTFTAATALVLADSGLRLWSAIGGITAQGRALRATETGLPQRRARVMTRVSYGRSVVTGRSQPAPLCAAA